MTNDFSGTSTRWQRPTSTQSGISKLNDYLSKPFNIYGRFIGQQEIDDTRQTSRERRLDHPKLPYIDFDTLPPRGGGKHSLFSTLCTLKQNESEAKECGWDGTDEPVSGSVIVDKQPSMQQYMSYESGGIRKHPSESSINSSWHRNGVELPRTPIEAHESQKKFGRQNSKTISAATGHATNARPADLDQLSHPIHETYRRRDIARTSPSRLPWKKPNRKNSPQETHVSEPQAEIPSIVQTISSQPAHTKDHHNNEGKAKSRDFELDGTSRGRRLSPIRELSCCSSHSSRSTHSSPGILPTERKAKHAHDAAARAHDRLIQHLRLDLASSDGSTPPQAIWMYRLGTDGRTGDMTPYPPPQPDPGPQLFSPRAWMYRVRSSSFDDDEDDDDGAWFRYTLADANPQRLEYWRQVAVRDKNRPAYIPRIRDVGLMGGAGFPMDGTTGNMMCDHGSSMGSVGFGRGPAEHGGVCHSAGSVGSAGGWSHKNYWRC